MNPLVPAPFGVERVTTASKVLPAAAATLLLAALGPAPAPAAPQPGIAWVRDYKQAVRQASEQGKWLFIDFYTDG